MPADAEIRGTREFRRTARKLKTAGNGRELKREMGKRMRTAAQPAVEQAQDNVQGIASRGVRGRGGQQRREYALDRSKTRNERAKRKAAEGRGLRVTIARALRTKITTTARSTGVRIEVDLTRMPQDQRELPYYINAGRWRHPVFGNRSNWVTQTATPAGWFDRAMRARGGHARRGAVEAVTTINRKIAE